MEDAARGGRPPRYRWVVCGLLFLATAINYVDRQTIGLLKPTLQQSFGWSEEGYAGIVFWFQAAYGLGYIGFGAAIDRLGARLGYAAAAHQGWSANLMTLPSDLAPQRALGSMIGGRRRARSAGWSCRSTRASSCSGSGATCPSSRWRAASISSPSWSSSS